MVRQTLAEARERHAPWTGPAQHVLEVHPDAGHVDATGPAFPAASALIAVAALKILLLGFHVAETRHVDAVGPVAKRHLVFVAGYDAGCTRAHVMVHQVVPEFAAAVGQAVGKFGGG